MKIKQFGILFGDNDYYNTFIPLLEYIGKSITEGDFDFTPDQLLKIINSLSFGTYILFQNGHRHNAVETCLIKNCLLIDESHLLINEDLDKYIIQTKLHNSECFYLILHDYGPEMFTVGSI